MKLKACLLSFVAALCAQFTVWAEVPLTPAYKTPILEVDVEGSVSLSQWLEDHSQQLFGMATLVKTGSGTLVSDADISSAFSGDIVISNGVFKTTVAGALGAAGGAVYVLDGAQYCIEPDAATYKNNQTAFNLSAIPIVLAGNGPSKNGALRVAAAFWTTKGSGDLHLAADATITAEGWNDTQFPGSIYLNGHTLFARTNARFQTTADGIISGPGTLDRSNSIWYRCNSVVTNGALIIAKTVQSWGASANTSDATLRYVSDGAFQIAGTTKLSENYNAWHGVTELMGPTHIEKFGIGTNYPTDETANFYGKVTGAGGFVPKADTPVDSAFNTQAHLRLYNAANDFQGGVVKAGGTLTAHANGALPAAGGAVVLTNATLNLVNDTNWSLPPLVAGSNTAVNASLSGVLQIEDYNKPDEASFSYGSFRDSVTKEDAGDLAYNTVYGADLLDVRSGRVIFPNTSSTAADSYGLAGLAYGRRAFADNAGMEAAMASATTDFATGRVNRVTLLDTVPGEWSGAQPQIEEHSVSTYKGYVWNRLDVPRDWTFFACVNGRIVVYFDGEKILDQSGATTQSVTKAVSAGPHEIDIRLSTGNGWIGTWSGAPMSGWYTRHLGFCIDMDGGGAPVLGSDNTLKDDLLARFARPADDGSGYLFTLTTNKSVRIRPAPVFGNMRFAAGTELNLNHHDYSAAKLEGLPSVTNGDFTVTGDWQLDALTMQAGACAKFADKLIFSAGSTLTVTHGSQRGAYRPATPVAIVHAEGGIEGLPEIRTTDRMQWQIEKSADGKTLYLSGHLAGIFLLIQ